MRRNVERYRDLLLGRFTFFFFYAPGSKAGSRLIRPGLRLQEQLHGEINLREVEDCSQVIGLPRAEDVDMKCGTLIIFTRVLPYHFQARSSKLANVIATHSLQHARHLLEGRLNRVLKKGRLNEAGKTNG